MGFIIVVFLAILATLAILCAFVVAAAINKQNRTRKNLKRLWWALGSVWLIVLALAVFDAYDHRDSHNIRIALEMARLPPLPKSARIIKTEVSDSLFSLTIQVIFQAPLSDIKTWLGQAQELEPGSVRYEDRQIEGMKGYSIPQDAKVNSGHVDVDEKTGIVKIWASYS